MKGVIERIARGHKIDAIKEMRACYGFDLITAKNAVEAMFDAFHKHVPQPKRYIVVDRARSGDYDVTCCEDKERAMGLANSLVDSNTSEVYVAAVIAAAVPTTTYSMKEEAA